LNLTDLVTCPRLSATYLETALRYDRSRVMPGIVHLGLGAFHRAHMAAYIDDILASDPSWGIVGASLRRPDTRDALAPQDFLYTLAFRSKAGPSTRIIGSVLNVLDAKTQRDSVIGTMADTRIRIVSMLDEAHPDIVHDLANPTTPVSAPGLIVRALELRKAAGVAPFTVLSCDNLLANGETTKRIVTRFAALRGRGLADYVEHEVCGRTQAGRCEMEFTHFRGRPHAGGDGKPCSASLRARGAKPFNSRFERPAIERMDLY
jgi:fructuronate reductase